MKIKVHQVETRKKEKKEIKTMEQLLLEKIESIEKRLTALEKRGK